MKIVIIILASVVGVFLVLQLVFLKSQKTIETYQYTLVKKYKSFEVRSYEPTLFTSVKIPLNEYKSASGKGFKILAGYIFGQNSTKEKIAMTSPVTMSLEDSMTMMFMVPKSISKGDLPTPNKSEIKFVDEPSKTMAAISFGGWANDKKIDKYKRKLIEALEKEGLKYTDRYFYFGYNPPYEIFNRRNEVVVELERDSKL